MAIIGEKPLADLPLRPFERDNLVKHKKLYIMPDGMNHKEWKKVFVEGGSKKGIPYLKYINNRKVVLYDGND